MGVEVRKTGLFGAVLIMVGLPSHEPNPVSSETRVPLQSPPPYHLGCQDSTVMSFPGAQRPSGSFLLS